jgi:hypothetical protein
MTEVMLFLVFSVILSGVCAAKDLVRRTAAALLD